MYLLLSHQAYVASPQIGVLHSLIAAHLTTLVYRAVEGAHHALAETQNLSWRVTQAEGKPALEVKNRGDVHVRLSQVALEQGGQTRTVAQGLLGYVLPNSFRSWPIPAGIRQPDQISAQINARDAQWQSTPVN